MAKVKIHQIAKKLSIDSKEVIDKAISLGIKVKNHLSGITEDEGTKIEEAFGVSKKIKEKPETPVIIRREVIVNNEEQVKKEEPDKKETVKVGFVEKERKTDFNIVYREKTTKPLTVNELFGKKENVIKKESIVENAEIKKEPTTEINSVNIIKDKVADDNIEKKEDLGNNQNKSYNNQEQNRPYNNQNGARPYNNNQGQNRPYNNQNGARPPYNNNQGQNRPYNNQNGARPYNNNQGQNRPYNSQNGARPYNNNQGQNRPYNNQNAARPYNNNQGQNRPYNNQNGARPYNNNQGQNRPYNNQNGNRPFNRYDNGARRPLDERGLEKNIKNILAVEIVEKDNVREYQNKAIDKQKSKRNEENKGVKKVSKVKKNEDYDINNMKLKDLKQENKLTNMFDEGSMLDYYDLTTIRGKKNKRKNQNTEEERVKQKIFQLTEIEIPETITVKDFSTELKKTSSEIIKKLFGYGIMATINNEIDFDTAFLIAGEFGITAHKKAVVTEEDILFDDSEDKIEDLKPRPPVVVVMGHVDHGKTSLLDAVKSTNVIAGEAGGITQHIGAYKVEVKGREITFLDTPGHEAFTSMRARGAQITDIAILVVAANDGVMPQTIEAINHAKAAGIPIIVAINKIDLEGANPDKIKQDLAEYELVSEDWGGDTIFVPISAKKKINIDNLLEMVLLVADMKELKANPNKQSKGVIIEAKLDKAKGPIATMLVQRGTLNTGDTIVVGSVIGRIRTMINDKGQVVKFAGPSTPVEITGLTEVPEAGETFYEVEDEKTAKHLIEKRKRREREKSLGVNKKVTLDDLFSQIEDGKLKELNIIVKADVQGSVEAVKQSLEKLSNDEVKVKVIHANVGAVTETDVTLAKVSNAIIIAFNVRPEPMAKQIAEKDEVEIKTYSVIYNAIDDVQAAMNGMLSPVYKEVILGNAEVRQTFKVSNVGTIAGAYVTNGKVTRNAGVRVLRDNVVIFEGKLLSLKRFKDDAKEVQEGYECGIQIEKFDDIKEGDIIEAFTQETVTVKQ